MSLHEEFRPTKFKHVIGHSAVIKSLISVIDDRSSNAFLFIGSSGVGKTTLARITAAECGVKPEGFIEVSGSTHTGIDDMREVMAQAQYSVGGSRAVIVDECHRLSAQAWDSLLKIVEEPRANLFWFFCTTDEKKVPKTIRTRCTDYTLQPLRKNDLFHIVDDVVRSAKLDVSPDVVDQCVGASGGSAREALKQLAKVCRLTSDEAADVLVGASINNPTVIDLCKAVMDPRTSWHKAMTLVKDLEGESPEGLRIVVSNYLGKVIRNTSNDKEALRLLMVADAFSKPYNTNEGVAPLMLSMGRAIFRMEGTM